MSADLQVKPLVRAMVRALKAMGYYDERHPVFVRSRREAGEALGAAFDGRESLTLGCGGSHIVYDEQGPALGDDVAYALARALFDRSIVAIRLRREAGVEDLGRLLRALSEHPERVRSQGGVRRFLSAESANGIDVVEVDFAALFAGEGTDLGALVGRDPVVERALKEVLRFKDSASGKVLNVRLDELGTPESLGGFLDEILDGAGPGVVAKAPGAPPAPADGLSAASIADLAAEAFVANQASLQSGGADPEQVAKSARVLGDALVRLQPAARLGLLRKLAGADRPASPAEADAVAALSKAVDNRLIVDAIVSVLFDEQSDLDVVNEIGNLIRRLRPVERERADLLEALDTALVGQGRKMSGVVWQEIRARSLDRQDLGYLRIAFEEVRGPMGAAAEARRRGELLAVSGQDILQSHRVDVLERHAAGVVNRVLAEEREVGGPILNAARDLLDRLDASGAAGAADFATALLGTLVRRVDLDERIRPTRVQTAASHPTPPIRGSTQTADVLRTSRTSGPEPSARTSGGTSTSRPAAGRTSGSPSAGAGAGAAAGATQSARALVSELLTGPAGGRWTRRLVESVPVASPFMAEILLNAIGTAADPVEQELLITKLAALEPFVLEQIGAQVASYDRVPAIALERAAARRDVEVAMKIARLALRDAQVPVKEAALKALIGVPDTRGATFLAVAAGAQGEEAARRLLGLGDSSAEKKRSHALALVAVGALGLTRSPAAVQPLGVLLNRTSLFRKKVFQEVRVEAARALATNGTPEADRALADGAKHKKRAIREACRRAIESAATGSAGDGDAANLG